MKRGEIYWVESKGNLGSEQKGVRPAIIVSNDYCNKYSSVVEVVYMTASTTKAKLPTHVKVHTRTGISTALCEAVDSISKERIGDKFGELSHYEMRAVNRALAISLGLT